MLSTFDSMTETPPSQSKATIQKIETSYPAPSPVHTRKKTCNCKKGWQYYEQVVPCRETRPISL